MRRWLAIAASVITFGFGLASTVNAQQFPTKPIRLIVPFGPGTITDILARTIGASLSQTLGQPVVIENKPGADGSIGALELIRAAPDGHTLMMGTNSPLSVVPHLHKQPPYASPAAFTPISFVGRSTFFIAVHPSVPATTLPELLAHAKANPKKLAYGTGNTTSIVGMALISGQAGVDMLHVPYKSEPPAVTDLLSGQIHVMLAAFTTVGPHIKDGKLRALATILPERSPLLPDVPSMLEAGQPPFPVGPWGALVGPAGMPKDVVERLNKEVVALLGRPDMKAQFQRHGFTAEASTPEELATFLKDQLEIWGKTLKQAGIEAQ